MEHISNPVLYIVLKMIWNALVKLRKEKLDMVLKAKLIDERAHTILCDRMLKS